MPTKIEWTDVDWAWLAGFIDGEGSLSLLQQKAPATVAGVTFKPRMNISNKKRHLLERCREIIGAGAIVGPNDRGVFNLDISANGLRSCLPRLTLFGKQRQKSLLMEALGILARKCGRARPRSKIESAILRRIARAIQRINGRWKWRPK